MMIEIRPIAPSDIDDFVGLTELHARELAPHLDYKPREVIRSFSRAIETNRPAVFVAVQDDKLIGYIAAELCGYWWTTGAFAVLSVIYVRPDARGTRAAAKLIEQFLAWGDQLQVSEYFVYQSTGHRPDRFARLFEKFGFEITGSALRRIA